MSGGSLAAEPRGLKIHAFRYPDAPWEAETASSGSIFRELTPEEISRTDGKTGGEPSGPGLGNPEDLSIPVRYEYRLEPGFDLEDTSEGTEEEAADAQAVGTEASPEGENDRYFRELLAAESAKAEERGRAEGLELGRAEGSREGREEAIRQLHAGVEGERNRLAAQTAAMLKSFAEARNGYIHRLEQESARLALAIAARILRREAQTDPLLLTGAVRVALGQLSATTAVRLRVPAADLELWSEALAHLPNLAIRPELIGDPLLNPGDCCMETELGSANLGLDAQLDTLDRGFFEHDSAMTNTSTDQLEIREVEAHGD